jgi:hypothetical protein
MSTDPPDEAQRADGTVVGASALARMEAMRKATLQNMVEQAEPAQRAVIEEQMKTQARQMLYRIAEAFPSGKAN